MQAHGKEEMFMGHNQVGWSSNRGSVRFCSFFIFGFAIEINSKRPGVPL